MCKKCLSHPISKKSYATIQEALRVGMYKKYEYYNYSISNFYWNVLGTLSSASIYILAVM